MRNNWSHSNLIWKCLKIRSRDLHMKNKRNTISSFKNIQIYLVHFIRILSSYSFFFFGLLASVSFVATIWSDVCSKWFFISFGLENETYCLIRTSLNIVSVCTCVELNIHKSLRSNWAVCRKFSHNILCYCHQTYTFSPSTNIWLSTICVRFCWLFK